MASDIRRRTDHASVARIVDALRSISHPALARVIQECDTLLREIASAARVPIFLDVGLRR